MEEKKRGGYRPGSGRKPSGEIKIPITIYVEQKQIYPFGDKDNLKKEISAFISLYGKGGIETMQIQDLTKPTNEIKPFEQPQTNFAATVLPRPETPGIGKYDAYKDRLIGAVTIKDIEAIMREVKNDILSVKQKRELEEIGKECSKSMYTD